MVFSHLYGYAGSMDALARKMNDGRGLVVLDWKTSNRLNDEYAYQVAAYAKALEEMTGVCVCFTVYFGLCYSWQPITSGETVEEGWVVRFDKYRPFFEARRIHNLDESFGVFLVRIPILLLILIGNNVFFNLCRVH
jgi:hypothetical protein